MIEMVAWWPTLYIVATLYSVGHSAPANTTNDFESVPYTLSVWNQYCTLDDKVLVKYCQINSFRKDLNEYRASLASSRNKDIISLQVRLEDNTVEYLDANLTDSYHLSEWVFVRSSGKHIVQLPFDRDILSLGSLSHGETRKRIFIEVIDTNNNEKSRCIARLSDSCRTQLIAGFLLENVLNEEIESDKLTYDPPQLRGSLCRRKFLHRPVGGLTLLKHILSNQAVIRPRWWSFPGVISELYITCCSASLANKTYNCDERLPPSKQLDYVMFTIVIIGLIVCIFYSPLYYANIFVRHRNPYSDKLNNFLLPANANSEDSAHDLKFRILRDKRSNFLKVDKHRVGLLSLLFDSFCLGQCGWDTLNAFCNAPLGQTACCTHKKSSATKLSAFCFFFRMLIVYPAPLYIAYLVYYNTKYAFFKDVIEAMTAQQDREQWLVLEMEAYAFGLDLTTRDWGFYSLHFIVLFLHLVFVISLAFDSGYTFSPRRYIRHRLQLVTKEQFWALPACNVITPLWRDFSSCPGSCLLLTVLITLMFPAWIVYQIFRILWHSPLISITIYYISSSAHSIGRGSRCNRLLALLLRFCRIGVLGSVIVASIATIFVFKVICFTLIGVLVYIDRYSTFVTMMLVCIYYLYGIVTDVRKVYDELLDLIYSVALDMNKNARAHLIFKETRHVPKSSSTLHKVTSEKKLRCVKLSVGYTTNVSANDIKDEDLVDSKAVDEARNYPPEVLIPGVDPARLLLRLECVAKDDQRPERDEYLPAHIFITGHRNFVEVPIKVSTKVMIHLNVFLHVANNVEPVRETVFKAITRLVVISIFLSVVFVCVMLFDRAIQQDMSIFPRTVLLLALNSIPRLIEIHNATKSANSTIHKKEKVRYLLGTRLPYTVVHVDLGERERCYTDQNNRNRHVDFNIANTAPEDITYREPFLQDDDGTYAMPQAVGRGYAPAGNLRFVDATPTSSDTTQQIPMTQLQRRPQPAVPPSLPPHSLARDMIDTSFSAMPLSPDLGEFLGSLKMDPQQPGDNVPLMAETEMVPVPPRRYASSLVPRRVVEQDLPPQPTPDYSDSSGHTTPRSHLATPPVSRETGPSPRRVGDEESLLLSGEDFDV